MSIPGVPLPPQPPPPPALFRLPSDQWGVFSNELVVGADGIGYNGGQGWFVGWPELHRVSIELSYYQSLLGLRTSSSRLMLFPLDPQRFAADHPQIQRAPVAPHASQGGWAVWLGSDLSLANPIANALGFFAGPRFLGVRDHGRQSLF